MIFFPPKKKHRRAERLSRKKYQTLLQSGAQRRNIPPECYPARQRKRVESLTINPLANGSIWYTRFMWGMKSGLLVLLVLSTRFFSVVLEKTSAKPQRGEFHARRICSRTHKTFAQRATNCRTIIRWLISSSVEEKEREKSSTPFLGLHTRARHNVFVAFAFVLAHSGWVKNSGRLKKPTEEN